MERDGLPVELYKGKMGDGEWDCHQFITPACLLHRPLPLFPPPPSQKSNQHQCSQGERGVTDEVTSFVDVFTCFRKCPRVSCVAQSPIKRLMSPNSEYTPGTYEQDTYRLIWFTGPEVRRDLIRFDLFLHPFRLRLTYAGPR